MLTASDQLHKERVYVLPGVLIMFCEYGRLQRAGHAPSCYKRSEDERSLSVHPTTTNTRKMSTRNNRSRNKKGKVRRWLDSLLCVSSPESSPAPSAHRDSTSHRPLASEPASSGQNTEPSRQDVIPSTNEPRLAVPSDTLPVPSALSAEPQIPPPVSQGPILLFLTLLPKWMEPRAPIHEAAPATTTAEPAEATNKTWAGLPGSLRKLMSVAGLIPSVGDAARVLLDCVDTTEAAVNNKQDYEDLATELTALSDTLAQQIEGMGSEAVSKCVSGVAQYVSTTTAYALADRETSGIEKQAKEIKKKKERGTARPLLEASSDEKDVIRHYRRISRCFGSCSMNTWSVANDLMVNTRLEGLGPERQAAYDSALSETVGRRTCTEGTRTKVLSDLVEWAHDKNAPAIYWMNGMAGTGKNDRILIREWLKQARATGGELLLHSDVGCVPGRGEDRTDGGIPAGAVLGDIPIDTHTKAVRGATERGVAEDSGKGKGDALDNLVVVIDALDECEDQRGVETIVDMLFRYAPHLGLKFFVTSRPEPGIYENDGNVGPGGMVLHDIEKSLIDRARCSSTRHTGSVHLHRKAQRRPVRSSTSDTSLDSRGRRGHSQIDELYTAILNSALEDKELDEPEKEGSERLRALAAPVGAASVRVDGSRVYAACIVPRLHPRNGPSMLHIDEGPAAVQHMRPAFVVHTDENVDNLQDRINTGSRRRQATSTPAMPPAERVVARRTSTSHAFHSVPDQAQCTSTTGPDARAGGAEGQPDGPQRDSRTGHLEHSLASILGGVLRGWQSSCSRMLDGTVSIRNAYDGTLLVGPWNAHTDVVRSVVFSPDGRLVASGSDDRTIGVWDVRTGTPVAGPFHGHTNWVFSVSFSPDSKRIVSGSQDKAVCIWDTAHGTLLVGPLHGHTSSVLPVTYSPDGTLIASASHDNTIRLWRSDDGTPAFPTSSGSDDKTVRVWRVSDGSAVANPFQGHSGGVYSVAVSPDGMFVASGSDDRTVRVWRMSDGSLAAGPFVGHTGWTGSVGYSPDGTQVISGSADGPFVFGMSYTSETNTHGLLVQVVRTDDKSVAAGPFDPTPRVWQFSHDSTRVIVGFSRAGLRGYSARIVHFLPAFKAPVTSVPAYEFGAWLALHSVLDLQTIHLSIQGQGWVDGQQQQRPAALASVRDSRCSTVSVRVSDRNNVRDTTSTEADADSWRSVYQCYVQR
ncbi:WD40 repeat-like protein [Rhizoctonia solani]|uniref:WD40 repeat-like protein n=1 Tax=Rhizoctonia solani TaxID=456999 RepID=A0A8H7ICN7_9AGAM|nr:WD40 repeat-like protein [Rhizoctonia solani]